MIRHTPLSRSRLKKHPRKGDNPRLRQRMKQEQPTCACCGRDFVSDLHSHHILGGAYGRPDHPANLLTLCRDCHDLAHAGKLTRAMQLQLKIESDRAFLQSKMGNRRLEQPEQVPEEFRRKR